MSVTTASPTILLNADTGELVPHWAELDEELLREADSDRAFMIRPVVRLADATRYIVAIRHVVDATGARPSLPRRSSRRSATAPTLCDPSVALRRSLYADIFAKLEAAGIAKADLQLAWDYSTASRQNNTAWFLHMRDDALAQVGPDGPAVHALPAGGRGDDARGHLRRRATTSRWGPTRPRPRRCSPVGDRLGQLLPGQPQPAHLAAALRPDDGAALHHHAEPGRRRSTSAPTGCRRRTARPSTSSRSTSPWRRR